MDIINTDVVIGTSNAITKGVEGKQQPSETNHLSMTDESTQFFKDFFIHLTSLEV